MTTTTNPITAEQLLSMANIGPCELVKGEVIHMTPAGAEHGDIAAELLYRIKSHVEGRNLGKVYAAETGFIIARNPDTVRAPDVAFVRTARLPPGPLRGYFPGAPDLAVEVISPSDLHSDVLAKVDEWLAAGALSVWVVDPPNGSIAVFHPGIQVARYRRPDELRDEPVLPGFALKLDKVFESDR